MLRKRDGEREDAARVRGAAADLRVVLRESAACAQTKLTHAGAGNEIDRNLPELSN